MIKHKLEGKVWLYQGKSPWHFVTISKNNVVEIKKEVMFLRGFNSIKVEVKIGKTQWQTSIFPDKKGIYLLPIKKGVRIMEKIKVGDKINFTLCVI